MELEDLKNTAVSALEDLKGVDLNILDVRGISAFTDLMIIVSGTSDRHLKSLADNLVAKCKEAGVRPLGVEGSSGADWMLVDLGDVVVHIMKPESRAFYNLEKLWSRPDGSVTDSVVS